MKERESTVKALLSEKISAIIRTDNKTVAETAMEAAIEGGFKIVEFTLTTPGAMELITQFRTKYDSLYIGAGTVMTTQNADEAVKAGAQFIVSPVLDLEVVKRCCELDVVAIPGTHTPTEMQNAHNSGADFVKLFPVPYNVVDYIRYILGPQPHLKIFPTAGVNFENMLEVLRAGAAAVGFVNPLFDPELMKQGDFDAIREKALKICNKLHEL